MDANDNNDDIDVNDNAKDDKPTELWMPMTMMVMTIGRNKDGNLMIIKIAKNNDDDVDDDVDNGVDDDVDDDDADWQRATQGPDQSGVVIALGETDHTTA